MKKSKDHIRRFLSSFRPCEERDEHLIRLFLSKRKIKSPTPIESSDDYNTLNRITYEQFESWYNAEMPTVGTVVKSKERGFIGIVTCEMWDSFVVGVVLTPENTLIFQDHIFSDEKMVQACDEEISLLQRALSAEGYEWNPYALTFKTREVPQSPKYVRLMVVGQQVGVGIFKEILADNTLEMICVKMNDEPIRYNDDLNLGDADCFSFFDTYDEHRAIIQGELGEKGLIWNVRCRRLQKNNARAKAGKNYFWVSSFLEIKQATESGSVSDKRRFNRGNYFLKRAVALNARNRIINVCKEEMMSEDNTSS